MKELKAKVENIEKDIEVIKNNHLSHIEASMERMEKSMEKMDTRMWAIVFLIIATSLGAMFV